MTDSDQQVFQEITTLPDPNARRRLAALVGIDEVKDRLTKETHLLLEPAALEDWSKKHHGDVLPIVKTFFDRPPLFIFAGDVGTGKTALAETFGDALSRNLNLSITLYSLSLNTRGTGVVGQMTTLLSAAFARVKEEAKKGLVKGKRPTKGVIFLIDEADALAQSREFSQMHHEDRAGVNALIRGIDTLAAERLPAVVIMCTNRVDAIDPAVRRRAAEIFQFERPSELQRTRVLRAGLLGSALTDEQFTMLAKATGPTAAREYGCTYSDLTQRLLPTFILDAFPERPLDFERLSSLTVSFIPTAPFKEKSPF